MFSGGLLVLAALPHAVLTSDAPSSWKLPPPRSFGAPGINASYDYVIIGGGTAGLTIASRLSENPFLRVAVVEQGGFYEMDNGNLSTVPAYCTYFAGTDPDDINPLVDFGFVTQPQAQWATAVGDDSYTFPQLLPWYRKSPHYNPPRFEYLNSTNEQDPLAFIASGGPFQVSFGDYLDAFGTWAQYGFKALGHRLLRGFQSGVLLGTSYTLFSVEPTTASRSSSESSFLPLATKNTHFKLYNNSIAEKILFDEGKVAHKVLVSSQGSSPYMLTARKEIILSAGAFRSPQLLMLSGIGPRQQLEAQGIAVVKHLPGVGQNLWDQPFFATLYPVNLPTGSASLNNPAVQAAAVSAYNQNRTGPLTLPAPGTLGWEKLPEPYRSKLSVDARKALDTGFPSDWPELEFLPVSGTLGYQRNYQKEDPQDGQNYASISTALVAPLSRGNVTINSTRMADLPLINPNWVTHPADIELAIAAFKRQRDFWKNLVNITVGPEKIPGATVQTDAEILNFIRDALAPVWHAAGTCKMGRNNDSMAVVDSSNRVFGIKKLRIMDASVFPLLPPGHPQSTVYALAEKLAAEIMQRGKLNHISTPEIANS
ncbi:MAG: hypothetical protein Q9186_007099 [Xanthomendoza sp. 1 TL-2023]